MLLFYPAMRWAFSVSAFLNTHLVHSFCKSAVGRKHSGLFSICRLKKQLAVSISSSTALTTSNVLQYRISTVPAETIQAFDNRRTEITIFRYFPTIRQNPYLTV